MEGMTILELIFGGGLISIITSFITLKYIRRKAKGEAHSAEYEGMKVEQDTYQELIAAGYIATNPFDSTAAIEAAKAGNMGSSAPEPTSGMLLLIGGSLLALRRRRR